MMRRWTATLLTVLSLAAGALGGCGARVEGCPDVPIHSDEDCDFAHGKQNH
jgi:hypothetical protein